MKNKVRIQDITGTVAASKTVTFKFPKTGRCHDATLKFKNTAAGNGNAPANTMIAALVVSYNGEDIWNLTGPRIDAIQSADNAGLASQAYASAVNGQGERHLRLLFAQPTEDADNGKGVADRELFALPLDPLIDGKELKIKVTFAAGVTPDIECIATIDDTVIEVLQPVIKYETHDFDATSAAKSLVNQFPQTGRIMQLSLFDTDDAKTVEKVKLTVNNQVKYELLKNEQTTDLKAALMNPAAGCFHIPFTAHNGLVDTVFFGGKDVIADITLSAVAAGTLSVVSKRVELPKN